MVSTTIANGSSGCILLAQKRISRWKWDIAFLFGQLLWNFSWSLHCLGYLIGSLQYLLRHSVVRLSHFYVPTKHIDVDNRDRPYPNTSRLAYHDNFWWGNAISCGTWLGDHREYQAGDSRHRPGIRVIVCTTKHALRLLQHDSPVRNLQEQVLFE